MTFRHVRFLSILAVISLALSAFLIFQNLSAPAIRIWDEAIYADNALDMYTYGDPIVMKRNGELTLYNTKPPFVIWLQTLSLHAFGVNEFAIRFPSAIAGVLTCLMLLLFATRSLKDIRIGIVAVLVLATSFGYIRQHVVKTGDLDAVLVFWTTAYTLVFFHVLLTESRKNALLILWAGIGIACAFLTKGIAGFLPFSGLLVCVVVARKFKWVMTQKETYIAGIGIVLIVIGYYALREYLAAGYLDRTLLVDYGRFTTSYMAWHHQPWYYYFWNWERLDFFTPYVYLLPLAVMAGLIFNTHRKSVLLLSTQVIIFIGILSYPLVKLMWYDAPVYPLLALISATGFIVFWDWMVKRVRTSAMGERALFTAVLVVLFALPVLTQYGHNASAYLPVDILEREGFAIRDLKRTRPELKKFKVLMLAQQNAHYTQVDFYLNAYNRYAGYDMTLLRDTAAVDTGDMILCCQKEQVTWLNARYLTDTIAQDEIGCVLMKVATREAEE